MSNLPDKVWLSASQVSKANQYGTRCDVSSIYVADDDAPYLRSTPEREKAGELVEVLEKAKATICSLKLSMLAHPDCEEGSEFDDFTYLGQETEDEIEALLQQLTPTTTDHDKGN